MPLKRDELAANLKKRVDALSDPQPVFDLRVGWAADYDGLFEGTYTTAGDANSVLEQAREFGRVLIVSAKVAEPRQVSSQEWRNCPSGRGLLQYSSR